MDGGREGRSEGRKGEMREGIVNVMS